MTETPLPSAIKDLEALRKRLMQDTYYAGDALRLIWTEGAGDGRSHRAPP